MTTHHTAAEATATHAVTPNVDFLVGWLRGKDLNLRPLGYEPNELPDCSTPQNQISTQPRANQGGPNGWLKKAPRISGVEAVWGGFSDYSELLPLPAVAAK